ncbi:MAG: hypothetical protein AAF719_00520 [Pseudomonadota bacterium]
MSASVSSRPGAAVRATLAGVCDRYAKAVSTYSVAKIGKFWAFPALISVNGAQIAFKSQEAFDANTENLFAFYKEQGVVSASRRLANAMIIAKDMASIVVDDVVYAADLEPIASWRASYVLRRTRGNTWKIIFASADGEAAAWKAMGATLGQTTKRR